MPVMTTRRMETLACAWDSNRDGGAVAVRFQQVGELLGKHKIMPRKLGPTSKNDLH